MQPKIDGKYYLNRILLVKVLALEGTKISFLLLSLHQEDKHAKAVLYHDWNIFQNIILLVQCTNQMYDIEFSKPLKLPLL